MNQNDENDDDPLPTTARTQLAFRRTGIDPRKLHEFYIPGDLPERQHLRFRHYELRRRQRIDCVLKERARVIQELIDDSSMEESGGGGGDRTELLERIVSTEAKRLESLVQRQIKRRTFVEGERKKRAEKYGALERKLRAREAKVYNAGKVRQERSIELQSISLARFKVRDIMLDRAREAFEERRAQITLKQASEEAKLDQFLREKEEREQAVSAAYEARQQEAAERQNSQLKDLNEKRRRSYSKKEERALLAREKKQRVKQLHLLKGEESTLRLIDALEKKRELERRDAEKRSQIASLMQNETEKSFAFNHTKDDIVNQRKSLAFKALSTSSLELDHTTPGPAEYVPVYSAMAEFPGPKISVIRPKLDVPGTVDFATSHARSVPGPGQYKSNVLPDGKRIWNEASGLWATSEKLNFIDQDQRVKREIPGPATYELVQAQGNLLGPAIRRDLVNPSLLDWRQTGSTSPGPASYTVDSFTRTEQLINATKLAPVIHC